MTDSDFPWPTTLSRPMRIWEPSAPDQRTVVVHAPPPPPPTSPPPPPPTPVSEANAAIIAALDRFESDWRDIANAEERGQLTPEGRSALVAEADQSDGVDQAAAQAQARADQADANYRQVRAGLSPDSATAVAALRHNQWWSRTVRELDATPVEKLVGTARRLIETANGPELGWASVELPSYLRSRHVDDSWVNTALEQVNPKLKAAADTRRKATQAHAIISSNARAAKRAMQSAGHGSYRRPGLVDVSAFDPDAQAELVGAQRGPTMRDGYRP